MTNVYRTEVTGVSAELECIYNFDGYNGFEHRDSKDFLDGIGSLQQMNDESLVVSSGGFLPEDVFVYFTAQELLRLRRDTESTTYVFGRITPVVSYIISDLQGCSATLTTDEAILTCPDRLLTPRLQKILGAVAWEEATQFGLGDLKAVVEAR